MLDLAAPGRTVVCAVYEVEINEQVIRTSRGQARIDLGELVGVTSRVANLR